MKYIVDSVSTLEMGNKISELWEFKILSDLKMTNVSLPVGSSESEYFNLSVCTELYVVYLILLTLFSTRQWMSNVCFVVVQCLLMLKNNCSS